MLLGDGMEDSIVLEEFKNTLDSAANASIGQPPSKETAWVKINITLLEEKIALEASLLQSAKM